jgi:hypothetical protein
MLGLAGLGGQDPLGESHSCPPDQVGEVPVSRHT